VIWVSFELLADTLNEPTPEDLLPHHNRIPRVPHHIYPYLPQNKIEFDLHRVILTSQKDIPATVPFGHDPKGHSFPEDVPSLSPVLPCPSSSSLSEE
jgi:hypothetical protein